MAFYISIIVFKLKIIIIYTATIEYMHYFIKYEFNITATPISEVNTERF